jgi:hypothetical protein
VLLGEAVLELRYRRIRVLLGSPSKSYIRRCCKAGISHRRCGSGQILEPVKAPPLGLVGCFPADCAGRVGRSRLEVLLTDA